MKKWGPERVEAACSRAAEVEVFNVAMIGRMLERATESDPEALAIEGTLLPGRFARAPEHFATAASRSAGKQ